MREWKERARALFFVEKLKISEIAKMTGVSRKSVSKYIRSLPEYADEAQRRGKNAEQRRREYKRNWDRKNRPNRYSVVNGETIRREHDVAAMILSREKYY